MIEASKEIWIRGLDFKGITSRSSFWQGVMVNAGVTFLLFILSMMTWEYVVYIYVAVWTISGMTAGWRRARSAGYEPLMVILCSFIPFVGGLISLYFLAQPDKNLEEDEASQVAPAATPEPQTVTPSATAVLSEEAKQLLGAVDGLAESISTADFPAYSKEAYPGKAPVMTTGHGQSDSVSKSQPDKPLDEV